MYFVVLWDQLHDTKSDWYSQKMNKKYLANAYKNENIAWKTNLDNAILQLRLHLTVVTTVRHNMSQVCYKDPPYWNLSQ